MSITVSAGQPIRATHINQFTRWLTGVTKDVSSLLTTTHASAYTLTVTNEVATGNILKLGYGTGTAVAVQVSGTAASFSVPTTFATTVTFGSALTLTSVRVGNGTVTTPSISFSNSTNAGRYLVTSGTMADVIGGEVIAHYVNGTKFPQVSWGGVAAPSNGDVMVMTQYTGDATSGDVVMASFEMVTDASSGGAGSVPDSGAMRAVIYNTATSANNAIRAGEFHAIRKGGAGAHTNASCWVIEAGMHSGSTGNGATKVVGMSIYNNDWGGGYTSAQADSAIYIWGDKGWTKLFYALHVDNATVLADLNNVGTLKLNPSGDATAPTYSFTVFTNGGMFQSASGAVSLSAGGISGLTVSTAGLLKANVGFENAGPWILTAQITPAQLTTSANNYAPTGIDTCSSIQISSSTAVDLTGLQLTSYTGQTGRRILLINIGGQVITLKHNSGSSSVGNKFNTHTSGDFALGSAETVEVIYTSLGVWRTLGSAA